VPLAGELCRNQPRRWQTGKINSQPRGHVALASVRRQPSIVVALTATVCPWPCIGCHMASLWPHLPGRRGLASQWEVLQMARRALPVTRPNTADRSVQGSQCRIVVDKADSRTCDEARSESWPMEPEVDSGIEPATGPNGNLANESDGVSRPVRG
jgi:hypothetical protein